MLTIYIEFPSLPLLNLPVFQSAEFDTFAALVCAEHEKSHENRSVLLERAYPELAELISTSREAVRVDSRLHQGILVQQLEEVMEAVKGMKETVFKVSFTGLTGRMVPATPVSRCFLGSCLAALSPFLFCFFH